MYILVICWALPAQVRILPTTISFFFSFFFSLYFLTHLLPPPFFFFDHPNILFHSKSSYIKYILLPSIHSIPFHSLYSLPFTLFPSIHSIPFFPTLSYYLSTFPLLFGQSYFMVNLVRYVAISNAQAESCVQAHETSGY